MTPARTYKNRPGTALSRPAHEPARGTAATLSALLLQQNIFSIQTYDYLWSEYQRTTSCSEIGAFLMSKVHDEAFHGLPFTPIPPDDAINAPPAVFALQASLN